jgi:uncharacterized protein with von Willebrand factor type A (vWA) domain
MRPVEEILLGFARAVRAAGVPVTQDRTAGFLRAVAVLGAGDAAAVHRAGRATLCAGPDDLVRYDAVFTGWFGATESIRVTAPRLLRPVVSPLPRADDDGRPAEENGDPADVVRAAASGHEVLRHRDVATMSAAQRRVLDTMIGSLRPRSPVRRTGRRASWRRGELDMHRTLRSSLRRFGEPGPLAFRRRGLKPRRVVLLVDVSGSMTPYADALLRLAHVLVREGKNQGARTEVFTLGTRLTRVTDALRTADPYRALALTGELVPDWSGGTRLAETLRVFLDRWGSRGLARGAVVVVFSDGWERGDVAELGDQLARLHRLAHSLVWVNPHRGKDGYLPVQSGVVAAMPHLDHFLAGHSLATFERVLEVIGDA